MPPEIELEEYRKFNLIDSDKSCAITWNEYVEFETASILSKRNKVIIMISKWIFLISNKTKFKLELSNHLSNKELITAKRKFLSYDKDHMKMITKEDAKHCYLDYFKKLK